MAAVDCTLPAPGSEQSGAFEETKSFAPGTVCVAIMSYQATEPDELSFSAHEIITIVEPSDVLFWYIGRTKDGKTGKVPVNYLEDEDYIDMESAMGQDYIDMDSAGVPQSLAGDRILDSLLQQESKSRFHGGTNVLGRLSFAGESPEDLPFDLGEELIIIEPTSDLGWYTAKRLHPRKEQKLQQGTIPVTHVRCVYVDVDSEEEIKNQYDTPLTKSHDRYYSDINDFLSSSGWFNCLGKPLGLEALQEVLAKKCGLEYNQFIGIGKALYMFSFGAEEKLYVGKADTLHKELATHFECFGKKRKDIRAIDDELCHHSSSGFWKLMVWSLGSDDNLEVEWAKVVCSKGSLQSPGGVGLNEHLTFTHNDNWELFKNWFYPKS